MPLLEVFCEIYRSEYFVDSLASDSCDMPSVFEVLFSGTIYDIPSISIDSWLITKPSRTPFIEVESSLICLGFVVGNFGSIRENNPINPAAIKTNKLPTTIISQLVRMAIITTRITNRLYRSRGRLFKHCILRQKTSDK